MAGHGGSALNGGEPARDPCHRDHEDEIDEQLEPRGRPAGLVGQERVPRRRRHDRRPRAPTNSPAAAAPGYRCWPVISLPSRTAKAPNIGPTTKFVPSIRFVSSSIPRRWILRPIQDLAKSSALSAKPVQVRPFASRSPVDGLGADRDQVIRRIAACSLGIREPAGDQIVAPRER
jgi:hypothetical protein